MYTNGGFVISILLRLSKLHEILLMSKFLEEISGSGDMRREEGGEGRDKGQRTGDEGTQLVVDG